MEYYSCGIGITTRDGRGVLMITCFTGKFLAIKVRDFAGRTDDDALVSITLRAPQPPK
jgi:hypothetical protein